MKFIRAVISTVLVLSLMSSKVMADNASDSYREQYVMDSVWGQMTEDQKYNSELKYKANAVRLSEEEFTLFSQVVEAESDGKGWEGYTSVGRIYVAACIWDRLYDDDFPNTVTGVLTDPGQFTTVSGGKCYKKSTLASEWAIIQARFALANGEIPTNMLYFNCISYFRGFRAFDKVGDNYFSTTGDPVYATVEDEEFLIENFMFITRG